MNNLGIEEEDMTTTNVDSPPAQVDKARRSRDPPAARIDAPHKKEVPKGAANEKPKVVVVAKEMPKQAPKEVTTQVPKEMQAPKEPKQVPKKALKQVPAEAPMEAPKQASTEAPMEAPKQVSTEAPDKPTPHPERRALPRESLPASEEMKKDAAASLPEDVELLGQKRTGRIHETVAQEKKRVVQKTLAVFDGEKFQLENSTMGLPLNHKANQRDSRCLVVHWRHQLLQSSQNVQPPFVYPDEMGDNSAEDSEDDL